MKKIVRNMSTEQSRAFWETAERSAAEVERWPARRRAGINVSHVREQPRETAAVDEQACGEGAPKDS